MSHSVNNTYHAIYDEVKKHPYPLLFATGSGSRVYGSASPTSDYDIHGCHLLPLDTLLGIEPHKDETVGRKIEECERHPKLEIATHDLRKFVFLLLKSNGNVLEDLYSPMVFITSPAHEELKELAKGCMTKQTAVHYQHMALAQQRNMLANPLKKLLHMYRCLLMGIWLMQHGKLLMQLPYLADLFFYKEIHDLIFQKQRGDPPIYQMSEQQMQRHLITIECLILDLEQAREKSTLPEEPSEATRKALEQFIIRIRKERHL